MGEKYFTISYDDGLEQDAKLISLMKKYGIEGTFNLNSGCFDKHSYIRRLGDIGFDAKTNTKGKCVNHYVMPRQEALKIYQGVEIASHGTNHVDETKCVKSELEREIQEDVITLSEMFNQEVKGHVTPFGASNENVRKEMKVAGLKYGRSVRMLKKPKDFYFRMIDNEIAPTCWHLDKFTVEYLKKFINMPCEEKDLVFYMWGHGYELDYGTKRGNWDYIENIFKMISDAGEINKVTNIQLVNNVPMVHY